MFSARFLVFSTGLWPPFSDNFEEGRENMPSLPPFLTLWILMVFADPWDEDILVKKVRTKRVKRPKT